MIWVVFSLLTAATIFVVARPLARAERGIDTAADVEAYKSQLEDLARDRERGLISDSEAEQTRAELARRLLKSTRGNRFSTATVSTLGNEKTAFFVVAGFVALTAISLYMRFGKPDLPDQPLEARLNQPPDQMPLDLQILKIERHLRKNPRDVQGWTILAPVYFRTNQFDKAADAFRRIIELAGPNEERFLGLGEAETFAQNGVIPPVARTAFGFAVKLNPKSIRGRFWLALADEQDGNYDKAETFYKDLQKEEGVPDVWKRVAEERISNLAVLKEGKKNEAEGGAQDRSQPPILQGEQGDMIRGMVDRLSARLKENPNDLEGWLRLIRSYKVLQKDADAAAALSTAQKTFANDTASLEKLKELAQSLNISASPGG